ncbi:hypothetical protein EUGRSUZ_E01750 [Eucalyptus grandis]|uniref:Uncharacterized protein n=2 Tax=Eucalyptus grandis TaxID=71139 RepID=A0A059C4V7_EUCGR|nr:hypothetical protein EUGRSUZ_E01750 [Eucalyptus grandis]
MLQPKRTFLMILLAIGVRIMLEFPPLYSPRIYEKADLTSIHVAKTLPILIPIFRLDMDVWRNLMITNLKGMSLSLGLLNLCFISIDRSSMKPLWAIVACIPSFVFYIASYAIDIGPITSVYNFEVFTLRLHAREPRVGTIFIYIFIPLYKAITLSEVAFIFMIMSILKGSTMLCRRQGTRS